MLVTLLLTLFLLALVHHYTVHYGRKGRLINRLPGLSTIPIFGNAHHFTFHTSQDKFWKFKINTIARFHPIVKFWIFSIPNVYVFHPDDVEKILSSTRHIEKGFIYNTLHPWLGEGLLTSKGAKWHQRRKMLTPAFHFSILKKFVNALVEEGNRAVNSFDRTKETVIQDTLSFTSQHTLNAICETSMGISLNEVGEFEKKYRNTIQDLGTIVITRYFKPWLLVDRIFNLSSLSRKQTEYLNILHSFTDKIIAERKQYHEQTGGRHLNFTNTETEDVEEQELKKKRMAMLDILIAESRNNKLSDLDIREEVDTFVFEGHDTVSIAVFFSLLLFAEHKDIQERARIEINEVMQECDGKLTINSLQQLSYLERCIKEALRLYPSVHYIARRINEDLKLQSYLLPADTHVHVLIYDLHRNANFWPNPDVFDPDRFLPENVQKRHPYAYVPFSAGPRNCIGQRFAMLELKALIAPLLYNFYMEPVDYLKDAVIKADITLRTTKPLRMKFIPIEREMSGNK